MKVLKKNMPNKKKSLKLNTTKRPGVCKKSQKFTRKTVLKMLAVMEGQQTAGPSSNVSTVPTTPESNSQEFLTSGRTGRRNALPDILGEHALVTSSDLPARLQSLTTTDKPVEKQEQSTSKS